MLEAWWKVARDDFAQLREGKRLPEVRLELLSTLKAELIPLTVLDEFQAAGVFVNWWQQIRFDLKTIVATGWHHSLIPDEDLIAASGSWSGRAATPWQYWIAFSMGWATWGTLNDRS